MGIEGKVSIPTVQYILIVNIKKKNSPPKIVREWEHGRRFQI